MSPLLTMKEASRLVREYRLKLINVWNEWETHYRREIIKNLVKASEDKARTLAEDELILLPTGIIHQLYTIYLTPNGKILIQRGNKEEIITPQEFLEKYCITLSDVERYIQSLKNPKIFKKK
jgi:hypothetical protein